MPGPAAQGSLVARAADDKTAHTVSEQDELLERALLRLGVCRNEGVEEPCERAAVVGDGETRVVADVERREPGVCGELAAIVAPVRKGPDGLGGHEAVDQHDRAASRGGPLRLGGERCFGRDGATVMGEAHRDDEAVVGACEVVPDDAVQDRECRIEPSSHLLTGAGTDRVGRDDLALLAIRPEAALA
jgi:hypothetical protein